MPNANSSLPRRSLLAGGNALKIGLFGANCSSGRAVTKVPERWSGTWADNLRLAQLADEAGIDFLLPIGRWKGYGGDTGYQEATLETVTWATGLLQVTKRITVFGTVHAPLFHPIIAAKQMVTLINVFTVAPENQQRLVDLLTRATDEFVCLAPGFIGSTHLICLESSGMHTSRRGLAALP